MAMALGAALLIGPQAMGQGADQGAGPQGGVQEGRTRAGLPSSPSPTGARGDVEKRQRDAGIATPPERDREQLRDLNDIAKQLTPPGTPLPAPELGTRR